MTGPTPTASDNRFNRHPVITGLAIAAVLLVSADLIVGSVLYGRRKEAHDRGPRLEQVYRVRHPLYHHDLRPGIATDSASWGGRLYRVRTNSLGFKDASTRVVDTTSASPRVLLIGDSFTEGVGVEYDSTFAGFLATDLRGGGVDVLNAAVISYSPIIYWKKIEDLLGPRGVRLDEVVVLLDLSDIQDEIIYGLDSAGRVTGPYPRSTGNSQRRMTVREFVRTHSVVLRPAMSAAKRVFYPSGNPPSCAPGISPDALECRVGWTKSEAIMAEYGTRGIVNAREHMSRLAALLKARGIPLTVVVYPWPNQLRWDDRRSLQSAVWKEWAAAEGAGFVDLFPAFFAAADSSSVESAIEQHFIAGDAHWNASGGKLAERAFLRGYCRQRPSGTAVSTGCQVSDVGTRSSEVSAP